MLLFFLFCYLLCTYLCVSKVLVTVSKWFREIQQSYFKLVPYLALVGKSPDSSCDLNGKNDKQEEEEL